MDFIHDLRERVIGQPEISTDGFHPYRVAIRDAFGDSASHGEARGGHKGPVPDPRYCPYLRLGVLSGSVLIRQSDPHHAARKRHRTAFHVAASTGHEGDGPS